jgi:hypothetical protein
MENISVQKWLKLSSVLLKPVAMNVVTETGLSFVSPFISVDFLIFPSLFVSFFLPSFLTPSFPFLSSLLCLMFPVLRFFFPLYHETGVQF